MVYIQNNLKNWVVCIEISFKGPFDFKTYFEITRVYQSNILCYPRKIIQFFFVFFRVLKLPTWHSEEPLFTTSVLGLTSKASLKGRQQCKVEATEKHRAHWWVNGPWWRPRYQWRPGLMLLSLEMKQKPGTNTTCSQHIFTNSESTKLKK